MNHRGAQHGEPRTEPGPGGENPPSRRRSSVVRRVVSGRPLRTASVGLVLLGLYGLYRLLLTPLVEPPSLSRPPLLPETVQRIGSRSVLGRQMAERYLWYKRWPAKANSTLRTDEAFVYYNSIEFIEDESPKSGGSEEGSAESGEAVRFEPFALIWFQKGRPEEAQPITIISDSAYVRFSEKFSIFPDPDPGRIVAAALQGHVFIAGPDGLQVTGKNFEFEESARRLWCDNRVAFRYGPHRGTAHGLQIELILQENAGKDKLGVSGIRSLRLRRDVEMKLVSGDEELGPDRDGPRETAGQTAERTVRVADSAAQEQPGEASSDGPRHVRIRSDGPFEFVVQENRAVFEDRVRVRGIRPVEPDGADSLDCDRLLLVFEPPGDPEAAGGGEGASENEPAPSGETAAFEGLNADLNFRRLRASGETVRLHSETNNLTAFCQELTYDAEKRQVRLTDGRQVRVHRGPSRMHTPEIWMQLDEEGEIRAAKCQGPGWLKHYNEETGALQLAADWREHMRKFTHPETGMDVIELKRQAVVRQPERKTGLAGDFIQIWLAPDPGERFGSSPPWMVEGYWPHRLTARTNVAMISPQLELTEADQLEVRFEESPGVVSVAGRENDGAGRRRSPGTGPQPPEPHGRTSETPSPPIRQASAPQPTPGNEDEPQEPVAVSADQVRVQVVLPADGGDPQVAEVWTEGNVRVQQQRDPGRPPANLTGDRVRIVNKGGSHQVLHVLGDPASIEQELRIEADDIEFDRHENRARVNGAGLLELPVKQTLQGDPLDEPKLLDVWWAERMTFDGKRARFFGDVRAVLDHHRIRCAEMEVVLAERISFQEENRREPGTEGNDVERIICRGGVRFDSATYEAEKLVSLSRGFFGRLSVNHRTGRTEARGPGWIVAWRRGEGKRAALSPSATVQANRPLRPDITDWEYFRIDFSGTMEGNINDRLTTFHNRVEIVYGPVQRPLATLDVEHLPEDGGWLRCDHLNLTQYGPTGDEPKHLALKAEGNAELEGRGFYGRADRITYEESKGVYTLHSRGDQEVSIWHQEKPGQKRKRWTGQQIQFTPSENKVKSDRTTGIDGFR